jgi:3-methyladenine DNA glycosylase AlkD
MKARSQSSSIPTRPSSRGASRHSGTPCRAKREKAASAWNCRRCLVELRRLGSRKNVAGMERFAIRARKVYGVSKPKMDALAKRIGKDHALALRLWNSGVREARILAGMIDEPGAVTAAQMDGWARDFDSWDVCDGTCCHLFAHTALAWQKAFAWSRKSDEFQKRAGFALMAYLAVHDKRAGDHEFSKLLPILRGAASDDRNFVRKAVNWALRQIGKRNLKLNRMAVREAQRIRKVDSRAARWIAADALRELRSEAVRRRLRQRSAA